MPKPLGNALPLKITGYTALFLLLYFILPVYFFKFFGTHRAIFLFLFYAANFVIVVCLFRKNSAKIYAFDSLIQDNQERLNLLNVECLKEVENNLALKEKSKRYNSLKVVLEKINQSLDLDEVADNLTSEAFSLIGAKDEVCVLYLVDNQTQKLALFKAKKGEPNLVVKSKEGNILDIWVLRHASPLLIEDIKNDFRFDLEKLRLQDPRSVASLIAAPFISENKLLGLIKLDSKRARSYTQDDLRFLVSISDLGALAIENSELFQRTQDLAIHDALTSLYTKGYFGERLKDEFKRCRRQATPICALMLDIDLFKNYNDKFGHTAGDIVLKEISRIIKDVLSNFNSIISRFGGEEFCAVITGMDKNSACGLADSLRERIEKEKIYLRRIESHVTVSIGVANFPDDAADEDELIQRSDKALYEAKQKGRNRVCCI
jgi:diguanylate cyclase (GGDEF)-like protein